MYINIVRKVKLLMFIIFIFTLITGILFFVLFMPLVVYLKKNDRHKHRY